MPYYKVTRSVQIHGYSVVEADSAEAANDAVIDEDNQPCYQRAWPDNDDIQFGEPEEITEEEFNALENGLF